MAKTSVYKIIFYVVLSLFVLYLVLSALGNSLSLSSVETKIVEKFTYYETVRGDGMALRSETLILAGRDLPDYELVVKNGDRVGVDTVIGTYYTDTVDRRALEEYNRLLRKENELAVALNAQTLKDPVSLSGDILSSLLSYAVNTQDGDFSEAYRVQDKLQTLFDRAGLYSSAEAYKAAYDTLKKQRQSLQETYGLVGKEIKSPYAGYFSSTFDGYEYLDPEEYATLTVLGYYELMNQKPTVKPFDFVGKTQDSPTWYFAALFDASGVSDIAAGDTVTLEFDIERYGSRKISAYVNSVSSVYEGKVAIVFRSSTVTDYELAIRKTTVSLLAKKHTGLSVPTDAIHVEDGQKGVYVLIGSRVLFKPVEVVYTDPAENSFTIVEPKNTVGSRALLENDEVIVGGKDLFDGKVLNVR